MRIRSKFRVETIGGGTLVFDYDDVIFETVNGFDDDWPSGDDQYPHTPSIPDHRERFTPATVDDPYDWASQGL